MSKASRASLLREWHAEWQELIELCNKLTAEDWNKPTLCDAWQVRDVIAHLVGGQKDVLAYFTGKPENVNQRLVRKYRDLPYAALTQKVVSSLQPGLITRLIPIPFLYDTWIHQQDIRWMLGPDYQRRQDPARMLILLSIFGKSINRRNKRAGADPTKAIQFKATDLDWQAGQGKTVQGPAEAILMVLAKRPAALDRLEGSGVEILRYRWSQKH